MFRVTDAQISAAFGTVKCGPCGHVFSATEHQTSEPESNDTNAVSDTIQKPKTNDDLSSTEETKEKASLTSTPPASSQEISDIELIDDVELTDSFKSLSLGIPTALEPVSDLSDDDLLADDEDSDEAWARSLLMEHSETEVPPEQNIEKNPEPVTTQEPEKSEDFPDDNIGDIPDINIQMSTQEYDLADHSVAPSTSKKTGGLLWLIWALMALIALIGQLGFFYFEELSVHERLRPAYKLICDTFDCELPVQQDINSIASSGLSIRPHPTIPGALTVELILTNNALFTQPFPKIQLDFSDLNDQLVANRIFKPEEYLSGDVKGLDKMPVATPIHLSFEIRHPGEQAANFGIKVVQ